MLVDADTMWSVVCVCARRVCTVSSYRFVLCAVSGLDLSNRVCSLPPLSLSCAIPVLKQPLGIIHSHSFGGEEEKRPLLRQQQLLLRQYGYNR